MTTQRQEWGGLSPEDIRFIAGTYSVERLLKVGRLCVVIAAQHIGLNRGVVLKVLRPELARDEENVTRFLRVARQLTQVVSNHVAGIVEVDRTTEQGPPFVAMERLSGGSVRDLLILHGPPRLSVALDYLLQACRGLGEAHRRGVMHGDLRPAKLYRTHGSDGAGHIKLVDFGFAQALRRDMLHLAQRADAESSGGPEYRAPEQIAGVSSIEPVTDVWALGLTAYQLVTGKHPFAEARSAELLSEAAAAGPPSILDRVPDAPAGLDELLRRCLAVDPSLRPPDMAQVAAELQAAAAAKLPTVPPPLEVDDGEIIIEDDRGSDSNAESTDARQRFLGPAMGNRAVRGGAYSFKGGVSVSEETPFPRQRRRSRRRSEDDLSTGADLPGEALQIARQTDPTIGSRPTSPARTKERAYVETDPATPFSRGGGPSAQRPAPPQGEPADFRVTDPSPGRGRGTPQSERVTAPPAAERARRAAQPAAPVQVPVRHQAAASSPTAPAPYRRHQDPALDLDLPPAEPPPASRPPAPVAPSEAEVPDIDWSMPETPAPAAASLPPSERATDPPRRPLPPVGQPDPSHHDELELDLPTEGPAANPRPIGSRASAAGAAELVADGPSAADTEESPSPAPGQHAPVPRASRPQQFGPFVLEELLGFGRWSEVFLARSAAGDDPASRLVVKRARAVDVVDVAALKRDIQLRSAVAHPHLVRLGEMGFVGGVPYLTSEYVDGVDARRLLHWARASDRSVPYAVSALIVRRVASALAALHDASSADGAPCGMVHGDVRPSKVYLSVDGEVKLGHSSVPSDRDGASHPHLRAKFDFQAPEELGGEPRDCQSDVFALGVVLGELLIGQPIFPGSGLDVLFAIQEGDIAPLIEQAPMLPAGLFDVCEKALARFRSDRFADAHAMAEALEPFERANDDVDRQLGDWVRQAQRGTEGSTVAAGLASERTAALSLHGQARAARQQRSGRQQDPPLQVRRAHTGMIGTLSLPQLIEAIATGAVGPDDEVNWTQDAMQAVRDIPALQRHLLRTAPSLEGSLIDTTVADHVYDVAESPMLAILAQMRQAYATGLLLVAGADGSAEQRREIYLQDGQLVSVRSSEPDDLFGAYLVRRRVIEPDELTQTLAVLRAFDGNMGNALVGLELADPVAVYRAIRQQATDRVAVVFGWPAAQVHVFLSCLPEQVSFPLGLDLTRPMLEGVCVAAGSNIAEWLPPLDAPLEPGPRLPPTTGAEVDGVPLALRLLGPIAAARPTVRAAVTELRSQAGVETLQAAAAVVTALALQWVVAHG